MGADGVYARGGVRLAAEILVRADAPSRVKMVDLIASQARDCGMDLQTLPLEFEDLLAMMGQYPHNIPRTDRPFDLSLAGMSTSVDPGDELALFSSTMVSDAAHPDGQNFVGFSDPAFDQLLDAGRATYDQAERARIYRQAQEELASQLPVIFLFAWRNDDDVAAAVATVDGPLDLASRRTGPGSRSGWWSGIEPLMPPRRAAMDAGDRRAGRTDRGRATRIGGLGAAAILVATSGVGLRHPADADPVHLGQPGGRNARVRCLSRHPAPAYADTLRFGFVPGGHVSSDRSSLGVPAGLVHGSP